MTIPANDFHYFEQINALVQQEPADALDPEIMGPLAAIGMIKGRPFNPDDRMKKILTDAAAIGTATARTLNWRTRESEGFAYYPGSAWVNMLFVGGYDFETPPPMVTKGAQTIPADGLPHLERTKRNVLLRHRHHPSDVHAPAGHRLTISWGVCGFQGRVP